MADVDVLLIGMGERYAVTAGDGAFPFVALAEGKNGLARAVLSTGRIGTVGMFTAATPDLDLGPATANVALTAQLGGAMMTTTYDWSPRAGTATPGLRQDGHMVIV